MNSLRKKRRQVSSPSKEVKEFSCEEFEDSGIVEEESDEGFDIKLNEAPYYKTAAANVTLVEQTTSNEGKLHRLYSDGRREVVFQNGVKREIWDDGYSLVYFTNGDIKQTYPATHRKG